MHFVFMLFLNSKSHGLLKLIFNNDMCMLNSQKSTDFPWWHRYPRHKQVSYKSICWGCSVYWAEMLDTLGPRQNGRHFADDIFKCIFLNENVWIQIKISLKFVPKDPINNIPALVQIMAWCCPGAKPLSEAMVVNLPSHICVTWPQWVNTAGMAEIQQMTF